MRLDDSELSGLSEEERLALSEDDVDATALAEIVASAEENRIDDEPAAAVIEANPEKQAADKEDKASPAAEDESAPSFVPRYNAEPVAELEAKMADLDKKFEDGDLTLQDYNSQRDQLNSQRIKAEISSEQAEQFNAQKWEWEVSRFMREVKKVEGIDYANDTELNREMDTIVRVLANDPRNAEKEGEWFLSEAHRLVKVKLGLAPAAKEDGKTIEPKKAGARTTITTLGDIPAADLAETGQTDEFAAIDRLLDKGDVMGYERALGKLSKDEQARYLGAVN